MLIRLLSNRFAFEGVPMRVGLVAEDGSCDARRVDATGVVPPAPWDGMCLDRGPGIDVRVVRGVPVGLLFGGSILKQHTAKRFLYNLSTACRVFAFDYWQLDQDEFLPGPHTWRVA